MKKANYIILLLFIIGCGNTNNQTNKKQATKENEWLWEWVESWEYLSKETFNLKDIDPPDIMFFDSIYLYSNSIISTPNGIPINGPDLYNQKIEWRKQEHNSTLVLPDSTVTNVHIMTFAAPKINGSYFVMPAPNYWKKIGLKNDIVSTRTMLNGIFVHEFAHTRQIEEIKDKLIRFEKNGKYEYPVNDDILQNYFQSDSLYTLKFMHELDELYEMLNIEEPYNLHLKINEWLKLFRSRQKVYLNPVSIEMAEIDNVFLTMEGIGQYAMMKYYMSDIGGNYSTKDALIATRHNKKWWSQEEGLGLILLYEKLVGNIDWSELYSLKDNTIIDLIEKKIYTGTNK